MLYIRKYVHCGGCPGFFFFGIHFVTFEQIEEDDLTNAAYESASSFFTNDTVRMFSIRI